MGVQVDAASVKKGFTRDEDPKKYFPAFQASNVDAFIRVSTDKCAGAVDALYDVDYSALASDDSDLSDVVAALGAFSPIISQGTFSLGSIINTISITQQTIEQVLDDTSVSAAFQTSFNAGPCKDEKEAQVFAVKLAASGTAATSNPKKATAQYSATLIVGGKPKSQAAEVTWKTTAVSPRGTAEWSVEVENLIYTSAPFIVVPSLNVTATSDDEVFRTNACAINVASIVVTITTVAKSAWQTLPADFKKELKLQGVDVSGSADKEKTEQPQKKSDTVKQGKAPKNK